MPRRCDYIVIGGGSAGSVVAARLSERPDVSVLLVEAGGGDTSPFLRMPLAFRLLRKTMMFDWGYSSEPEPYADHRSIPAARGRVLGGSSSVNGMMYSRGDPRDYDEWERLGARGWSFDEVLPFFKRSENNWRGASERHGGAGPLAVSRIPDDDPLSQAVMATARKLGYRVTDDFEADTLEGFGLPDCTIHRGRRASASMAYLTPARKRANLTIVTSAHATRILADGKRAVGVEYLHRGRMNTAYAGREIILSGGAYSSPQLLMLSGIGPADHLRRHDIPIVTDLPGVGSNLQEHPLVPLGFRAKRRFALGSQLRADRIALSAVRWLLTGEGIAGSVPLTAIAFHKSDAALERTDLETILMPTSLDAHIWFPGVRVPRPDVLTSLGVLLRSDSRGCVQLRSGDPLAKPLIRFNLLAEPTDVVRLRYNVRWIRDLIGAAPLADSVGDELFPGARISSDDALDAYIRRTVVTAQHPVGTCRMGAGDDAVVDPQLRVRGIDGLRVADASVMPVLIGGHTNAPAIMIGERAAQFLIDDL